MKYLRIKAISNCVGIRRSSVDYINKASDLNKKFEYPLNLIDLKIDENLDKGIFFQNEVSLKCGTPIGINLVRTVNGLNKEEKEYVYFEILPLELDEEAVPFYEDSIKKGYIFDEKAGEFEYILGLIYENFDLDKANEYFKLSKKKNFSLASNKVRDNHII